MDKPLTNSPLEPENDATSGLELGRLYADRGDFLLAIEKLKESADKLLNLKNFQDYLKAQNLLLRLYAETEQEDQINEIKEKLQDLVIKEGLELNSKTYYSLALCASYKAQDETAFDYLQKALTQALQNNSKEDMCYAISGLSIVYAGLGKYEEALKEIYNLQIFFEVLSIQEIKISTQILNGWILREMKRYDQALVVLWQAYDLVKQHKTLTGHIQVMFSLGKTYLKMGDKDMARLYLNLAYRLVDSKNMIRLAHQIEHSLDELGDPKDQNYDLIIHLEKHALIEKKLGKIDFRNQFILLDLLKLFVQNQGQVYTKEYLVENVWKQKYDPAVHDNKIYVTIKRLRKMIEPDFDKPKYIFRAKNGYFMNKSARILIDDQRGVH